MKKIQGLICNIQKFSIHDGPGIRTVVFLKGCPLSCKWCSNPESQSPKPELLKPLRSDEKEKICGIYKDADSVITEILQDKDFYEESGGGVTLSGGEALMQIDFTQALLTECKKNNLHTAIETSGFVPEENFKRIFDVTDLFLYDIKHYDSDKHKQGTGVDNGIIIQNLYTIVKQGKNILVRIPVIPRFNDSLDDAKAFACFFRETAVKEIQLLPFHQFGQNKYRQLGLSYAFDGYKSLHTEDLEEYKRILEDSSLKVIL